MSLEIGSEAQGRSTAVITGSIHPPGYAWWATVFDTIPMDTLVFLSQLSPHTRALVNLYLCAKWMECLSHFVDHAFLFRTCLRVNRAAISGPIAISFLLLRQLLADDLEMDVYCNRENQAYIFSHLKITEGYTNYHIGAVYSDGEAPFTVGIYRIVRMSRTRRGETRQINIIISRYTALYPLTQSWSTLFNNYISADSFCVTYPAWTFKSQGMIHPSVPPPTDIWQKHIGRGQSFHACHQMLPSLLTPYVDSINDCLSNPYCPHQYRFYGDQWCLQLVFDEDSARTDAPVDKTPPVWRYGGDKNTCPTCGQISDNWVGYATPYTESS